MTPLNPRGLAGMRSGLGIVVLLLTGCNSVFDIQERSRRPMCADPLMIDDMEDGDGDICRTKVRNGGWYTFGDSTVGAELSPPSNSPFLPTLIGDGSRGNSRYAAHFSGSGFTEWGAIMGLVLIAPPVLTNENPGPVATTAAVPTFDAAQGVGGITFWMKSSAPVSVAIPTSETTPTSEGGQCADAPSEHNCDNHFQFQITAPSPGWAEYQVPFNALRQAAGSAIWNPRHLMNIQFQVPPEAPFDVWVDDLAFYKCAGPECQPTCTDPIYPVSCRAFGGSHSSCRRLGTDCAVMSDGCADPQMIDDMEDGDEAICALGGRSGRWTTNADARGTGVQPGLTIDLPTQIPGGRGDSHYAARLVGTGFSDWGAILSVDFDQPYDAAAADGITFWMKSTVPVSVEFPIPSTVPTDWGGECDESQPGCTANFQFSIEATGNKWVEYKVPFAALSQGRDADYNLAAGLGTWDASRLNGIRFVSSSSDFDVWVDDLRFYSCGSEVCLPTCRADLPVACPAAGIRSADCWPAGTDCASPPDFVNNSLWGTGPNDVWIVGWTRAGGGSASHWDGATWTRSTVATPPIWDVWGSGKSTVWGIGDRGTLLQEKNSVWSVISSDTGTPSPLGAIWGSGPSDIWAIGAAGTTLHWDGVAWSAVADTATSETLIAVWGSQSDDVWAVGQGGAIIHWDGAEWSPSLSGTTTYLVGIWGGAGNDVWAVGNAGVIVYWNGSAWGPVESGTSQRLYAVWGSASNDVWAVGAAGTILHWDGSSWVAAPSGTSQNLLGVWGSASNDVWAVGATDTLLHWDGSNWSASSH
jgi:hypothetical protein